MKNTIKVFAMALSLVSFNAFAQDEVKDAVSVSDVVVKPGDQVTLAVALENETEFTAFQMDIELPVGITAAIDEDNELLLELNADRKASEHDISGQVNGQRPRVLAFSTKNQLFKGNSGELFTVELKCDESVTDDDYEIKLTGIKFSEVSSKGHVLADKVCKVTVCADPTGIESIDASASANKLYNLAGQRVSKSYKGIVVKNGKKSLDK